MQHTMTMFIAEERFNKFMRGCDLRPPGKWYCQLIRTQFETDTPITPEYFQKIITASRAGTADFWVPAIRYAGEIYHAPDVRIISDGEYEIFCPATQAEEQPVNHKENCAFMDHPDRPCTCGAEPRG